MINTLRAPRMSGLLRGVSLTCLAFAAPLAAAAPAMAQDASEAEVEQVIITGSRTIRDGSQAPTPVSVVSVEQLTAASPRNMGEAIAELPAFRGSSGPQGPGPSASANNIGSRLNLRGLGEDRTLVLLDGRRVAPGDTQGRVNFDMLPQSLFRRVDVVTGGASAAYGSDAVAGVVNVILDTAFEGIKGSIQAGISTYEDTGSQKFELTAGQSYMDDRLHVIASYGNRRQNGVYEQRARPFAEDTPGRFSGAGFTSNLVRDFHQANATGGVILGSNALNPTALHNIQFLPGGVPAPFDPGIARNAAQIGGDGSTNYNTLGGLVENETFYVRAAYDVTENLEVFIQTMFAETHNRYEVTAHSVATTSAFTIYEGNYYLPASVQALLTAPTTTFTTAQAQGCLQSAGFLPAQYATGVAQANLLSTNSRCFRLTRFNIDFGRLTGDFLNNNTDIVLGFNSTVFGDWQFDGYWEHGQTASRTFNINNIFFERVHAAADVIANPAVGGLAGVAVGAPICRASIMGTPANPNPTYYRNCVPINLFGEGSVSPEADAYVAPTAAYGNDARQDVWALNLSGSPFALPAGDVSFAFGAEYRKLRIAQWSGAEEQNPGKFTGGRAGVRGAPLGQIGVPGSYGFSNLLPYSGDVQVKEAYTEINIPLLSDLPFVKELAINAAGRYTDYSTSGPVKTWKVGATYQPNDSIRFRGTVSRDIRAPSAAELFATSSRFERTFRDPFDNQRQVTSFDVSIGNPNLDPEIADSLTAGIVFTPSFVPNLTVTLDYYSIDIDGAISALGTQGTLDRCFASGGAALICGNIDRLAPTTAFPAGQIVLVRNSPQNFANVKTSGFDLEIGYRADLGFIPGSLNTRLLLGFLKENSSQDPGGVRIDRVGQTGSDTNPRTRGMLQMTYNNGPWEFGLQENYISSGTFDVTLVQSTTINDNYVPAYTSTTVRGSYKFGEDSQYEAYVIVNNLFNVGPPFLPGGSATSTSATNTSLFDLVGRYYTAGLKFRF